MLKNMREEREREVYSVHCTPTYTARNKEGLLGQKDPEQRGSHLCFLAPPLSLSHPLQSTLSPLHITDYPLPAWQVAGMVGEMLARVRT